MAPSGYELITPQGHKLPLNRPWMRLGSSQDNDFVIPDPNVAAYHLHFHLSDTQIVVEDVSPQKNLMVNGHHASEPIQLQSGDRLKFGNFEFELSIAGARRQIPRPPAPLHVGQSPKITTAWSQGSDDQGKNRKTLRIALVAGLVLMGAYLFVNDQDPATNREPAATVDGVETTKSLKAEAFVPLKPTPKSIEEIRAVTLFNEGLRDYNNGLYGRAIIRFDEALSMNPNHQGALDYTEYCHQKIKDKVEALIMDGERSFNLLQYGRVRSRMSEALSVLVEQVPGFGQKLFRENEAAATQDKRLSDQELNLIEIPCERTRHNELCKRAVDLLKQARTQAGEDEIIR